MRSTGALAGISLPRIGRAEPDREVPAKSLIHLHLSGGMSHLDTFDPKPGHPQLMGKTRVIATAAPGIGIGHWLPATARVMDRICVIRSMQAPSDRHDECRAAMMRAPWLQDFSSDLPPGAPGISRIDRTNRNFHQGEESANLSIGTCSRSAEAGWIRRSGEGMASESPAIRDLYGSTGFAAACLGALRAVRAGERLVIAELGGWDAHVDQFAVLEERCREFDPAFAGLIMELGEHGLLDRTLVVVTTDFGRSPEIQGHHRGGRGHHAAAFSCLLAGAGVRGGTTYGSTDETGSIVTHDPVSDADFHATVAAAIGLPCVGMPVAGILTSRLIMA